MLLPYGNKSMRTDPLLNDLAKLAAEQKRLQDLQDQLDPPHARELRRLQQEMGYDPHFAAMDEQRKRVDQALGIDPQMISIIEQERQLKQALAPLPIPTNYLSPDRALLDALAASTGPRDRSYSPPAQSEPPPQTTEARPTGPTVRTVADIGRRVRDARKAMGMTQQRFADLAGVGRRFLIELEQGKPTLEIERVLAVCQAAGLKLQLIGAHDAHP